MIFKPHCYERENLTIEMFGFFSQHLLTEVDLSLRNKLLDDQF